MAAPKKILATIIKVLIGVLSLGIIYYKLKSDFTSDKLALLLDTAYSLKGFFCLIICLLFIPLNWGIESYKWKIITQPVEQVSFKTAMKSVYSGVCLGNLAPGRATEFLAKIFFFKPENRSKITVLHFVGGMFQLSITILLGMIALLFKFKNFGNDDLWVAYLVSTLAVIVLGAFIFCLIKINKILSFVSKKISKQKSISDFEYQFTRQQLVKLFGFSILRYLVFSSQMLVIINLFNQQAFSFQVVLGIWLYFLITSIVPMISFIEAAIRAAVALIVFKGCGISNAALALSSILVWVINIVIPSIVGYFILIKQKFNFKLTSHKK
ncbi:MAG: lysylphosphatidylglycerol synthase domain-containing protein [Bacteroidota bacterium]|nr:lysylphosphatidylglycerol synthase domain-containing protein [Bacteroidota bacterium]